MKIVFTIEAPEVLIEDGLPDFAAHHGWKPTVVQNGVEAPNPVGMEDYSKEVVRKFVLESIVANKAKAAQMQLASQIATLASGIEQQATVSLEILQ